MWRAGAVYLLLLLAVLTQAATPVDRVIKLLEKLRDQIQDEGMKEAVTYDKYSCFCKDESDRKVYAIQASDKKIAEWDAAIEELKSEIQALDQKSTTLQGDIATKETEIETGQKNRNTTYTAYVAKRKLLVDAVDVVTRAIATLQASKADSAAYSAALLETESMVARLPASMDLTMIQSLQAPTVYNYSSSSIIGTLQALSVQFKKSLADLDMAEGGSKHASDMDIGAKTNTKTSMEAEKAQADMNSAAKTELMNEKRGLHDEELAERNADQAFLDHMTSKCEEKAAAWDARSKTRAAEITAITDAVAKLKSAAEVYSVNSNLVGLISKRKDIAVQPHNIAAKAAPAMLLQLRTSKQQNSENKKLRSLTAKLTEEAEALKSAPLALLAVKLANSTSGDHFVKVRGIIKDLISKLEAEAISEATSKGICDTDMKAAIEQRDNNQLTVEQKTALVDTTEADIKSLTADILEQSIKLADAEKFKKELTDLRALEKAQNEKAIADAQSGIQDLDAALNLLQGFYGLVQQAPVDRYNETLGDKAPETFTGNYTGKVDASKGVIGILEVIKSDFQRTLDTYKAAELKAEEDFTQNIKDVDKEISDATSAKGTMDTALTGKKADLTTAKDDLKSASEQHELAIKELEKLQAACIAGEETYKERSEHRQKEIAALKEALQILIDWKGL